MWAMEMFSMTPKVFEAEYPDSTAASLSRDDSGTQYDWSTPDAIYIARYYEVRIEKVKLSAWRNPITGSTAVYDEDQIKDIEDELKDGEFELLGERQAKSGVFTAGLCLVLNGWKSRSASQASTSRSYLSMVAGHS